jgi:hypothetical protein
MIRAVERRPSLRRGREPATFPLNRLIPGWQAGIPGMKVGGIRVLHIPYQFAYGERGAGADIPPKCDLVFAIELKDVKQDAHKARTSNEGLGAIRGPFPFMAPRRAPARP